MALNEYLKDSEPVLDTGTGTPYIAIFQANGKPIMDPQKNLPLGIFVSDFEYTYKEEDADEGNMTIETDNPELVSHPAIQFNQTLILQWGYIYPHKAPHIGPARKLFIEAMKSEFTPTGVKIKLTLKDSTALSKNMPASYAGTGDDYNTLAKCLGRMIDGFVGGVKLADYQGNVYSSKEVIIGLDRSQSDTVTEN